MNFWGDFGAEDAGRLTPFKDDKLKDTENSPFEASSVLVVKAMGRIETSLVPPWKSNRDEIILNNKMLDEKELTIVGVIKSPLYLSSNKGTTNLLSGVVNHYGYINIENINSDNEKLL